MKGMTIEFKRDLRRGNRTLVGSWVCLGHPSIVEMMVAADFEWVCIDLEHNPITLRETEDMIRIIDLKGKTPLVRLTSNNSDQIKRVMDSGAHGIIVPMVNCKEDVTKAFEAIHYPPLGNRDRKSVV